MTPDDLTPGTILTNNLGAELEVLGPLAAYATYTMGAMWRCRNTNRLFGSTYWIVTLDGLSEAGYKVKQS